MVEPGYIRLHRAHSTKPFEDGVRYAWSASGELVDWAYTGWMPTPLSRH
jgi:hypothetical protein